MRKHGSLRMWLLWCLVMAGADIQSVRAQSARSLAELTDRQRELVKEHLPLGLPGPSPWVVREGYVLSYNSERQIPNWVAYHVRPDFLRRTEGTGLDTFRRDPDIDGAPDPEAPWPANYVPTRLAPLEVMSRSDPRTELLLVRQANYMGNVVFLDRRGLGAPNGPWWDLQGWLQQGLVADGQQEVWVIAGCVAGEETKIPSTVFQVIYQPLEAGRAEALAFLLRQSDSPRGEMGDIVPLEEVARLTGLDLFPDLSDRPVVWEQAAASAKAWVFPEGVRSAESKKDIAASKKKSLGKKDFTPSADKMDDPELAAMDTAASDVASPDDDDGREIVPVFYGTDRQVDPSVDATVKIKNLAEIRKCYGPTEANRLHLGVCRVSVPKLPGGKPREIGTIQLPGFFESPVQSEHFMLAELEALELDVFRSRLNDAIKLLPAAKQAFVYIHGFNNSFEEAAYRAAQMFVDLDVKCVPIMYTWPSRGSATKYKDDSAQVVRSIPHMQEFLRIVARNTDAEVIHLIAHSMGTQLLTTALAGLPDGESGDLPRLNQIILAAPDIDAQEFVTKIAPKIERFGKRITIYQSNRDQALYLSQFTMHDPQVPRLGLRPIYLSKPDVLDPSKFDQVDATWVADSDVGHTYFGNTSDVIKDIRLVLAGNEVERRGMLPSYLMRGEVAPWQPAPVPWYLVWWKFLAGVGVGAVLTRFLWPRRRKAKT